MGAHVDEERRIALPSGEDAEIIVDTERLAEIPLQRVGAEERIVRVNRETAQRGAEHLAPRRLEFPRSA
jgi:hypothetical protein